MKISAYLIQPWQEIRNESIEYPAHMVHGGDKGNDNRELTGNPYTLKTNLDDSMDI